MNWRLIFTGIQPWYWLCSVIIAILLAATMCTLLLKYERRLVSRRIGLVLLGLRIATLLLLLITLLQPVATRSWDISTRGRIVVAIDVSDSMSTSDSHAPPDEKLRWAQALGTLGTDATRPLLDDWVQAWESGETPDWLGSGSSNADPQLAAARRDQVMAILRDVGELPRDEFVRRLLLAQPRENLRRMGDRMPVEVRVFAGETQTVREQDLSAVLESDHDGLAAGDTDVVSMLAGLLSEEQPVPLRGVVLLSDGRQTRAGDPDAEAARLGALGVPVYTIPIGSRIPPRDLSLVNVDCPETVFLNDAAQLNVALGTTGFEGQEVRVHLMRDGEIIDTKTVTPASDSATVSFAVPAENAGRFEYQLVADVAEGELRTDNNARGLSIRVVDNKARVMLLDGDARWEFRYLRNLLERDKQTELVTVLFRQPWLKLLDATFINSQLPPQEQFQEQLAQTDILIVGDVPPDQVEDDVWKMITKAVSEDGLTLVVIPGRRDMPNSFQSPELTDLLPVTASRQLIAEQLRQTPSGSPASAFRLAATSDGRKLPMLQLTDPQRTGELSLSDLPGQLAIWTCIPKPSATVWVTADLPPTDRPPEPVIVHQYFGFGQVLWLGIDSTWRWRMRRSDTLHHQFWGQLVRWAARNRAAAGNDQVRLTVSDVVIDDSENVEAVARFSERVLPQLATAGVQAIAIPTSPSGEPLDEATLTAEGRRESATVLQPAPDSPGRYSARLPSLPSGHWNVQLKVEGASIETQNIATAILVQPRPSVELARVSCNRDLLQQLATESGGQMIEAWNFDTLLQQIEPEDDVQSRLEERTLYDHWLLLLVFFGLLMTEWCLRKLNGLP